MDPRDPSGGPGTIPVTPKLSRWPKLDFLYFFYLRTILELLVTSGISSGTPNNFRVSAYSYCTTLASPNLKCVDPTGSGDMQT